MADTHNARDTLIAVKDSLANLDLPASPDPLIEAFLVPHRKALDVTRKQVMHSLGGTLWKSSRTALKYPAGGEAFVSWQRAQTGLELTRNKFTHYTFKVREARPGLALQIVPPRTGTNAARHSVMLYSRDICPACPTQSTATRIRFGAHNQASDAHRPASADRSVHSLDIDIPLTPELFTHTAAVLGTGASDCPVHAVHARDYLDVSTPVPPGLARNNSHPRRALARRRRTCS